MMANPPKTKEPIPYTVAGWVSQDLAPWRADDSIEWTYARKQGDITVFARNEDEALATIEAHGFKNLDKSKLRQTGGRLTDYLKRSEIK